MTMMIAIGTIHSRRPLRDGEIVPGVRNAAGVDVIVKPGSTFDTVECGIDAAEEQSLVNRGAARRANVAGSAHPFSSNPPHLGD